MTDTGRFWRPQQRETYLALGPIKTYLGQDKTYSNTTSTIQIVNGQEQKIVKVKKR